ncbi:MAG TPA: thymidine kinase [Phycisphaerae bacterium]|nr:thymidine kinase [Phycisphaerae bacterium]HOB75943.1 thymidine kinase [Phycisphaerae bacterium]HOJ55549.1 thymidine kinase [Phycisphaerae bacterium]HOL27581.1 thymidine kinase [Phycisphaerae bacterium]HPP21823.1 thymidine kinase [Phycisphaerae bacterium]
MTGSSSTRRGRIELICGPMFSGKTERLLEWLAVARAESIPVAVFKHACDDRYHDEELVTHNGRRATARPVASAEHILRLVGDARLVVIDEAQFFGIDLVDTCRQLAEAGCSVVLAGLDRDSWGEPFGPMPYLEKMADRVTHMTGRCAACGGEADHTQRIAPITGTSMIGGSEAYEPRCSKCFVAPPIELRR